MGLNLIMFLNYVDPQMCCLDLSLVAILTITYSSQGICLLYTAGDQVNVEWSVSESTVHTGSFPLDWLKDNSYSSPVTHEKKRPLVAVSIFHMHIATGLAHTIIQFLLLGLSTIFRLQRNVFR